VKNLINGGIHMRNIKEVLESKIGKIENKELVYAVNRLEDVGLIAKVDSPAVIFDRLSTYIDEYRREKR
jgi:hypothetical protein